MNIPKLSDYFKEDGTPIKCFICGCPDLKDRVMETALKEIAKQQLFNEMDDHTGEHADWQGAYEAIVKIAREALTAPTASTPPSKPDAATPPPGPGSCSQ